MEKRVYYRQLSPWWECLDTEADNIRVNPKIFQASDLVPALPSSGPQPSKDAIENCYVIKEAFQKFLEFLLSSHRSGCTDKTCLYNPNGYKIKLSVKYPNELNPVIQTHEIKIKKKRGRKSKYEMQQLALLRASNGVGAF